MPSKSNDTVLPIVTGCREEQGGEGYVIDGKKKSMGHECSSEVNTLDSSLATQSFPSAA